MTFEPRSHVSCYIYTLLEAQHNRVVGIVVVSWYDRCRFAVSHARIWRNIPSEISVDQYRGGLEEYALADAAHKQSASEQFRDVSRQACNWACASGWLQVLRVVDEYLAKVSEFML